LRTPEACGLAAREFPDVRTQHVFMFKDRGRILIVDDEPSVADALKLILVDEGFGVEVAGTGRDGIELARRVPISLSITDLCLPDMSGLDVLDALLRDNPRALVIVISAQCTPEVCAEARRRGAAAVLSKPFLPADLLRHLNDKLARR
jgi:DNA-binding NtrC family response regulator